MNLKYPLVLAHGFFASRKLISWQRIARHLRKQGVVVFVTEVSGINTIPYRANQLRDQIKEILESTGSDKINLMGHSMGGLDGRYVIAKLGLHSQVASLTTISSPHRGTEFASAAIAALDKGGPVAYRLLEWMGAIHNQSSQVKDADIRAAFEGLTIESMKSFNDQVPNHPDVYYQSVAGFSEGNVKSTHLPLLPTHRLIHRHSGENDGLVSVSSATWGNFLGKIPVDHFVEVGAGNPRLTRKFDYPTYYGNILAGLAQKGF